MKERIINLLTATGRPGVNKLIKFLAEDSDFFVAPCSTKFHLAVPGGLVIHTLNVVKCATELNDKYESSYPIDSIIIAAVGHDLCKVNFYKEVHEAPTDPQMRYLTSLLVKAKFKVPTKLNKAYAGILIDFLLNTYKDGMELPPYTPCYQVEDQLPLGHGEKSLYVIQQFIQLTPDEALAIRWHMASFDAGIHFDYPSGFAYREAVKQSKLVTIITIADMEASYLVED